MLGGLLTKVGARADDRSLTVLPQRFFVVPLHSRELSGPLRLGHDHGEVIFELPAIEPAAMSPQVIVVRVPPVGARFGKLSGEIVYSNDASTVRAPGDELPYILGGRCVRAPTYETLRRYQSAGYLIDMTTADLRELYRLEGIVLPEDEQPGVPPGAHVLEGGRSLAAPVAGSLGFARLFCTEHPPYRPRSEAVARLMRELNNTNLNNRMEIDQ